MTSLIWEDGEEYCAPIQAIFPALEVGLMYNKPWFSENNIKVPSSWTELKEVSKQLKDMGSGLSPWPKEADDGHFWALALQVLVPMMQGIAAEMDTNGDMFVGADEALPAYRNGLIGPKTELYQRAFREVAALNLNWIDAFSTIDLETMFKKGDNVYLQYQGAWGFSAYANDPAIDFEVGFLPAFIPLPADIPPLNGQPGAFPPTEITKGDGKVPGKYVSAIQGADNVILKQSVEKHDNEAEAVRFLQFLTTPENGAFMINENQSHIPAAKDAELGSVFKDIAKFKVPMYEYSISWWGMGLYWDAPSFVQWRKVFVSYMQGIIGWDEFIDQMEQEYKEGSDRFEETLSK
jgi:maltose-binding protein MalE